MAPESTTAERKKTTVSPFGVEMTHPRHCDMLIMSIAEKLRSRITATKEIIDRDPSTGEQFTRPTSEGLIDGLPTVPGMQLHLNPADCVWKIIDPLRDDERLCERIKQVIEARTSIRTTNKLRGVEPRSGKIHRDEMKTLVREVCNLIDAGEATVIKGVRPEELDVESLPGDFLLEPLKGHGFHRPRYEKDLDSWMETLNQLK